MEYLVQLRSNNFLVNVGIIICWFMLLGMVAAGIYIINLFDLARYVTSAIAAIYVVGIVFIGNEVDKWWRQRTERQRHDEGKSTTNNS